MTDATDTPVESGDSFSREYVEKLKADLAAKSEETSMLKAFKASHEQKTRDVVASLQPDVTAFVDDVMTDHRDHASEMQSMKEWATSCHQSAAIDTVMPLARLMSCASATMKRTREEASVAKENTATLSNTMKELETTKADLASKMQRISELESLCNDRQEAAEKMQEELARAGLLKEKFDFSKASSREAGATDSAPAAETLVATTSNASKGGAVEDMLMSFVSKHSHGAGSHRIRQSSTSHAHLGVVGNTAEQELNAALRAF